MTRILFFTSSHKIGLTGQLTEQALAFSRVNRGDFLFISGEKEQFPGLSKRLVIDGVNYLKIVGVDDHADFLRLVGEFGDHAKRFRPDIVTVHTNWQLAIVVAARLRDIVAYKIVYIMHGYRNNYPFRSILAKVLIGLALKFFADAVITPSGFLNRQFGFLGKKNNTIYIGEDPAFFGDISPPSFVGTKRLIFAGEFRVGKNQELLIRAVRRYIDESGHADIELYLPGRGPSLESCQAVARTLGLEGKVLFPGFVDRKAMLALYERCQFALVPSNAETFGHCIVEPYILGRIVLTRHVGVADDVILDGETGFFFEGEDNLVDLLVRVLPDRELCEKVSVAARARKDQFRWEAVCHQHFDYVYDKLAASRS